MGVKSSKIVLPINGKNQVDLSRFQFENNYRDSLFTIYLPCAKDKPYYKSRTHSYIKLKLNEYIPNIWKSLISISTISEVIGIVPERIESSIFYFYKHEYYYEHYPSHGEGDIERTSEWLRSYIKQYGTKFNYGYCTSKIFREICNEAGLECFPQDFNPKSALFEFRRLECVRELTNKIYETYKKLLINRFNKWKLNNSHSYNVLEFAKENNTFSRKDFRIKFKDLQNPLANVDTFCHESESDKGIFFYFNKKDKKYHFPKFIQKFLNFQ
ncbi:hypothetical protein LCGC14_0847410 [marine sediment metagenome]|uniref:DUF5591 domain-containing protein n=1 Tax=marine sediment metagenome TaxID=412755 RepID=A0A0F9PWL6_9ZZZZ